MEFAAISGLRDAPTWMTPAEAELTKMLLAHKQEHLFAGWKEGADEEQKHAFYDQIRALEGAYPGGLVAYLASAKKLLAESAQGVNPFEGLVPKVPDGISLDYASPDFIAAEEAGLKVFNKCAFVLVAGGLGERLGYTDIKLSLPVQITTSMSYLELYAAQILTMQEYANKLNGTSDIVPLAIMTSGDTHARTEATLASHANFGMAPGQLVIMKQEKVAALIDNDARIAVSESSPYSLDTKPHGHGDVHTLLASTGLAKKWAAEGRKYIVFFQDTNALCFTVTIAAIGVSEAQGYEMNSVTVPRKAKDAVGAITKLVRDDGSSLTVNVEYNQLEPMLKASGFPDGDVNDPATGFSPFPGNINQLVLSVPEYAAVLERTGGLVPEFVNPKYADKEKTKFKKPTRLECMMQEHPKVLGPGAKVGFTTFPDWTYSPVKNSVEEARAKILVGAPGRSAAEGELEFYDAGCKQLAAAGVAIPKPGSISVFGFNLAEPPHVVFHPNFAVSFSNFRSKWAHPEKIHITQRSTLVVEGSDITFSGSLDLDGALIIKAAKGAKVDVKRLKVHNAGWVFVPLTAEDHLPASIAIRGWQLEKKEARVIEFTVPGVYTVEE